MNLADLGWSPRWQAAWQSLVPPPAGTSQAARVLEEHRGQLLVGGACGLIEATCAGRWLHEAAQRADLPTVGDWVELDAVGTGTTALALRLVPRRTRLVRVPPSSPDDVQVLAANMDVIFVVSSLDASFNLSRLERMVAAAHASGAEPVVVLNKADLLRKAAHRRDEVRAALPSTEVVLTSAARGTGVGSLRALLPAGRTGVFLGSSGVGKSSLVNALAEEELADTAEVRAGDRKGRHTTTSRQMLRLPNGGIVIDTPGIRELQLHSVSMADLAAMFPDVVAAAAGCRFRDCAHRSEPDCAVRKALTEGRLEGRRLSSYLKLRDEAAGESARQRRLRAGPRLAPAAPSGHGRTRVPRRAHEVDD